MTKKTATPVAHFHWHDVLVLAGAGILVAVSLHEGRWVMFGLGMGMIVALGLRVLVTLSLARRASRGGRRE